MPHPPTPCGLAPLQTHHPHHSHTAAHLQHVVVGPAVHDPPHVGLAGHLPRPLPRALELALLGLRLDGGPEAAADLLALGLQRLLLCALPLLLLPPLLLCRALPRQGLPLPLGQLLLQARDLCFHLGLGCRV
jgi:hypothetical protein